MFKICMMFMSDSSYMHMYIYVCNVKPSMVLINVVTTNEKKLITDAAVIPEIKSLEGT